LSRAARAVGGPSLRLRAALVLAFGLVLLVLSARGGLVLLILIAHLSPP
jgi:hypothetical protein